MRVYAKPYPLFIFAKRHHNMIDFSEIIKHKLGRWIIGVFAILAVIIVSVLTISFVIGVYDMAENIKNFGDLNIIYLRQVTIPLERIKQCKVAIRLQIKL